MDVLLFLGQSNMQGQTERLPEDNGPVAGAWEYRLLTDRLVPLCDPVGEDIRKETYTAGFTFRSEADFTEWHATNVLGASSFGNASLVPAFCRAYVAQAGREVAAVHAAKGSTVVAQWLPGTEGYAAILHKANAAFDRIGRERIDRVCAVWLQGESDQIECTTEAVYKERLTAFKDALKADLGVKKFGIIKVGRFTGEPEKDVPVLQAQEALCREDADFVMISRLTETLPDDASMMSPVYAGHYSCKGLTALGADAGEEFGRQMKKA